MSETIKYVEVTHEDAYKFLLERLAQAERERDDLAQMYSTRTRERDDAIKEVKVLKLMEKQDNRKWEELTAERDAAERENQRLRELATGLALENKATACGIEAAKLRTERDAALARAEEWEARAHREAAARVNSDFSYGAILAEVNVWAKRAADEQLRHGDLRVRIEALADSRRAGGQIEISDRLYDLLQPPKAETALDVLAEAERWVRYDNTELSNALAKLRKLLEEKVKSEGAA